MYLRFLLYFLFSTILNNIVKSQSLPISHFNTNDGLPSSETYSIYQDSKYRYWICTDNGVSLFNGSTFTNFSINNGLPTNTIFSSFENKNDGKMWFITYGFGLCYFDENIGKFKSPDFNDSLIQIFKLGFVNSCAFDNENNLWITYNYIEMLKVDNKGRIYFYPYNPHNKISGFEIFKFNNVTLVRNKLAGNISKENANTKTYKNNVITVTANIIHNKSSARLLKIGDSKIILAFLDQLFITDSSKNVVVKKMPSNILSIMRDYENNTWIGTDKNGIFCFKNSDFNIVPIKILEFKDVPISSLFQDKNRKIWFTTLTNGLYCFSNIGISNYLLDVKLQKIFIDSDKSYFIAAGGMVFKKSNKNGVFNKSDIKNEIKDIKRGPDNKVYTCKMIYNKTIPGKMDPKNIAANTIEFFDKSICIGNKTNYVAYNYQHQIQKKIITPSPILKMCKIDSSSLLVGCLNGLYVFINDKFIPVSGPHWLKTTRVNTIVNRKNRFYVMTDGKGILLYENKKLSQITQRSGLPISSINCMEFENDSFVWLGTSEGLYKAKIKSNFLIPVLKLTVNDGLPSNEINDIKLIGEILNIATNNGLSVFNIHIKPTNKILPLFFGVILANFTDTVFNGYSRKINLNLDKKWRNLYIKFSTNKDRANKLFGQISYRLFRNNEVVNNWTNISDNNVQFTNLKPGLYKIELKVTDDILSELYASEAVFSIQPYFTEIIWVRVSFWALLILLLFVAAWLMLNKIKYDNEIKRKMISAEINSLRNQMNPHFIFNALNSVQYFIFENNQEKASKFLSKFSTLIRKSLEFSKLNFISIQAEIDFITEYLEIEKLRFNNKFNYTIEIDPQLDLENYFIPPLLMQPLIENSIKHGFKEKAENGMIWIKLFLEDKDVISYVIKDNGKGMNNENNSDPGYKTSLSHEILKERFLLLKNDFRKNKLIGMTVKNKVFEDKFGIEIILKLPVKYD